MRRFLETSGAVAVGVGLALLGARWILVPDLIHPTGVGNLPGFDEHLPCDAVDAQGNLKDCEFVLTVEINKDDEQCEIKVPPPLHVHKEQKIVWRLPTGLDPNLNVKFANQAIRIDRNVVEDGGKQKFYKCDRVSDSEVTCKRQKGGKRNKQNVLSYTLFLTWDKNANETELPCFVDPLIVSRG